MNFEAAPEFIKPPARGERDFLKEVRNCYKELRQSSSERAAEFGTAWASSEDPRTRGEGLALLGAVHYASGEYTEAATLVEQSSRVFFSLKDYERASKMTDSLSWLHRLGTKHLEAAQAALELSGWYRLQAADSAPSDGLTIPGFLLPAVEDDVLLDEAPIHDCSPRQPLRTFAEADATVGAHDEVARAFLKIEEGDLEEAEKLINLLKNDPRPFVASAGHLADAEILERFSAPLTEDLRREVIHAYDEARHCYVEMDEYDKAVEILQKMQKHCRILEMDTEPPAGETRESQKISLIIKSYLTYLAGRKNPSV